MGQLNVGFAAALQYPKGMNNSEQVFGKSFKAFLFDMDGTLLSSLASAERAWGMWAKKQGLDVEKFLPTIHGARSVDTIRRLGIPGLDPIAEAAAVTRAEILDVEGITEILGAKDFLNSLPRNQWAIVTSAPKDLALARLRAVGMPEPEIFVTAEDVKEGKPNPDCYLLGAARLGASPQDCLVFEDAAVGIKAGVDAGAKVLVITAMHLHAVTTDCEKIADYSNLKVEIIDGGRILLTAIHHA